jgi:hypothetical protein
VRAQFQKYLHEAGEEERRSILMNTVTEPDANQHKVPHNNRNCSQNTDYSDVSSGPILTSDSQDFVEDDGVFMEIAGQQEAEDTFSDGQSSSSDDIHGSQFENGDPDSLIQGSNGAQSEDEGNPHDGVDEFITRIQLAEWAVKYKISCSALTALLLILVSFVPGLPRKAATLLKTGHVDPKDIKHIAGGKFYYFGVGKQLTSLLQRATKLKSLCCLRLQFNVDGLPLHKSVSGTFWPILGKILHRNSPKPFVVAIFHGLEKPNNLKEYLSDFVDEMVALIENGFDYMGHHFQIVLSSIICDAPARAFLKNIKPHMSYSACEKCITEGDHQNKLCFPELNAALRTDESFREMQDESHHYGPTPLSRLPIGLVTNVPIDYMHLVCLGIMKKLIKLWRTASQKLSQMSSYSYDSVSRVHESLCSYIPKEFARSPRALSDYPRWKATEFRTFLLYTGQVALHGNAPDQLLFISVMRYTHTCKSTVILINECGLHKKFSNL